MGFVKLNDNLKNWAWFGDVKTVFVYVRLMYEAVWQDTDIGTVHLERGQALIKQTDFANQLKLTRQELRTALNRLKSTNKITVKSTNANSIITILDYDCDTNEKTNGITNEQPTSNQRVTNEQPTSNQSSLLNTNIQTIKQPEIHAPAREEPAEKPRTVEQAKPEKREFAEFVSMTNDEYSSLVTKLGEQGAKRCVEILDNYKGQSGKTYKSDYRAILNWVVTRYNEERTKLDQQAQGKPSGTYNTGNPFTDLLRELDEQEAKEIDVPGYSKDYGNP